MSPLRWLWVTGGMAILLVLSIFFSSQKRQDPTLGEPPVMVVDAVPPASIANGAQGNTPSESPSASSTPCRENENYERLRRELGALVNKRFMREHETSKWIAALDEFRQTNGLPLAMTVTSERLEKEQVVYSNCKPSCKGSVHQVFVSKVIDGKMAEVKLNDGSLKKIALDQSGLSATTVDELNKKGIPFRSWIVPSADGPWFILGNNLFYKLDMEGAYLKISDKGEWRVVSAPIGAARLFPTAAPKVPGCNPGEGCYTTQGESLRHFKAPLACQSVVRHADDEVTVDKDEEPPEPKK